MTNKKCAKCGITKNTIDPLTSYACPDNNYGKEGNGHQWADGKDAGFPKTYDELLDNQKEVHEAEMDDGRLFWMELIRNKVYKGKYSGKRKDSKVSGDCMASFMLVNDVIEVVSESLRMAAERVESLKVPDVFPVTKKLSRKSRRQINAEAYNAALKKAAESIIKGDDNMGKI